MTDDPDVLRRVLPVLLSLTLAAVAATVPSAATAPAAAAPAPYTCLPGHGLMSVNTAGPADGRHPLARGRPDGVDRHHGRHDLGPQDLRRRHHPPAREHELGERADPRDQPHRQPGLHRPRPGVRRRLRARQPGGCGRAAGRHLDPDVRGPAHVVPGLPDAEPPERHRRRELADRARQLAGRAGEPRRRLEPGARGRDRAARGGLPARPGRLPHHRQQPAGRR